LISQLIRSQPVTDDDNEMSQRFYTWTQAITNLQILTGSGSPESVIEASITTLYMNTAGTAGNILYIKKLSDISGDRTQGWILV
jgi:hypothetical protein